MGALGLLAPLLYPLVTGRVFTRDDLAALHLPLRHLYREGLQAGHFTLWTPAYHAGYFLHGAGEAGMTHPLHLALYSWLPLDVAFNLEIISSYLFLFAGAYLLWRALNLSIEGAIVGAMLSAFSGFTLYNLMHVNHIATLAHAPWLLLACHGVIAGKRPAAALALAALVTGSQLLTGNPQYVWITLVLTICFCAWQWSRAAGGRAIAALALAALLGGLIGSIQLLPSIEFFNDSARAVWTREQALTFSLSPLNLVQLWTPFAFRFRVFAPGEDGIVHEFIVYNGALCTIALAWITLRWQAITHRKLVVALLALALLGLWLAFGKYGGLYPWLARLPVLSGFRAPSRHIVLFQFALAGLAGIAFEDLARMVTSGARVELRRLWPIAVPVALAILTIALAAALSGTSWAAARGMAFSPLTQSIVSSLPVVALAVLFALAATGRSWALPLVIALAVIDQAAWGYSYVYRWGPAESVTELARQAQVPEGAQTGDVIPPVPGGRDHLAILRGLRLTAGYTGLYPRSALDFANPTTERLAGIRWRGDGDRWHRVDDALPRARLVAAARISLDASADLSTIDVRHVALVDRAVALWGAPGSATVIAEQPGRFEIGTSSTGRQLLVLTERYHRGWRTTIDGKPAEAIPVYGDFLGTLVESGEHVVEFEFAPGSVTLGWRLSAAGLILTILTAVVIDRGAMLRLRH